MVAEALINIKTIKKNIVESKSKEETKKQLGNLEAARKALVKAKCGAVTLVKKVKKTVKKVEKEVEKSKEEEKEVVEKKIPKKIVLPKEVTEENVKKVVEETIK